METTKKDHPNYPSFSSRYAIGQKVTLNFHFSGKIYGCTVNAIRFTDNQVRYDIIIPLKETSFPEHQSYLTLIENVDSSCLTVPDELIQNLSIPFRD